MFRRVLASYPRVVALLVLCVLVAIVRPRFLLMDNIVNVILQASILIVLASGLTLTVITAGIDLSVAATLALAACVGGYLVTAGINTGLTLIAVLGTGVLIGIANGLLVSYAGLPAFIATYGLSWIAQGLANLVMRGQIFYGFPPIIRFLGSGRVLGIPVPILVAAVVVVLFEFILRRTALGKEVYAVGGNFVATSLSGVNTRKVLLMVYVVSGITASLAGLMYIGRLDAAEAAISSDMLLPALAAVVIGGTSLAGGEGSVASTVLGALLMTVITNAMNLLGVVSYYQPIAVGLVIICSVLSDQLRYFRLDRGGTSARSVR